MVIVAAGPEVPQGEGIYRGSGGGEGGVDVQPRDRDLCDLARRAANVSGLISQFPGREPLCCVYPSESAIGQERRSRSQDYVNQIVTLTQGE